MIMEKPQAAMARPVRAAATQPLLIRPSARANPSPEAMPITPAAMMPVESDW